MADLSKFERHALEALRGTDYRKTLPPSAVGYTVWEKCDPETRKRNPSPQGLALFASKFLRALANQKLAHQYHGWYITAAGLVELNHDGKATP